MNNQTMDANEFIAKLKANNTAKDISDLVKVFDDYKAILGQLPQKDRAPLSLNVLCVLCRNLDKSPKWRDIIDNKALLVLSIDCVRETRAMERADRVKTLACIYHIHRHVVRQTIPIPPELVLKISFMPFEVETKYLLSEYAKTYWNILVDRLSYIERLRDKIPIIKLLPKLTEDVIKIIEIYETIPFCSSILVFLVKKIHFLYTEKHAKELNQIFGQIFTKLSTKNLKPFKELSSKEVMEIYVKLNECLYVIAENASKTSFKDCPLDSIVRTCISIVGHSPDMFHCLQTFYSNSFCSLLTPNTNISYSETVLNGMLVSLETTEKLGYGRAMLATYPFLNQFLRLYIEFHVTNCGKKPWKDNFNIQIQEICLKLMQVLMKRLKNCEQLLKCDNCHVKSGLHDSLRLSFLVKHFITVSISQNILITDTLPLLHDVILNQYKILNELKQLGCINHEKCLRKLQTDIHNTAISLNKAQYYDFSIKLFEVYLKHEMKIITEHKNISRALYNKSICELDCKMYESALIDGFLSLVFASDGLSSDKYMSLVMDIKAKELKARNDDETKTETFQLISVLDACEMALEKNLYGDIKPFLMELEFSALLKHEFLMYAKLWPSVTPIGGVWRSLLQLSNGTNKLAEDAEATWTLYEVITETPTVVRNITGDYFDGVITELLKSFDGVCLTPDLRIVYATLLFWKTETELAAAGRKYGWKLTEPVQTLDPDQIPANRTVPQEYNATKSAIQGVAILAELSPEFHTVSKTKCLQNSLHIYQVFVQLLLHLSRDIEAMQLAHICCRISYCVDDKETYVRNAGVLLYHGGATDALVDIIKPAAMACSGLKETAINFLCDASIYYSRRGSVGIAVRLVQRAQAQILASLEKNPEINLDLAVGRLLEAQAQVCQESGPSVLSAVNRIQRHYLSIATTGASWHVRRLRALSLRVRTCISGARATRAARALRVWRRARAAAAAGACACAAVTRAATYVHITDTSCTDDAQIKIDNRLKHVLGLQPSNETQPYYAAVETKKQLPFTPKQEVETMLENMVFRRSQISPSIPCTSVPAFKAPDWFEHVLECECYACSMPACQLLACHTSGLEASVYFRAKEKDIARNYFNGVIRMLNSTEGNLRGFKNKYVNYEEFIVESVVRNYLDWFREVKVEVLMELALFELSCGDFDAADENLVEIHEVYQSSVCSYTSNEIMNLMACSARLRNITKMPDTSLEAEFESLRLSPVKYTEPPSTPITKPLKPPKIATKLIVKDEELPKKRKVIKLKLDDDDDKRDDVFEKKEFKVPEPVTSKHVLEAATPRTRSKPTLLVTQPSQDSTPNTKNTTVYSTPKDFTPDQFFTPQTSVKTYVKKSLRCNIVKNLEQEFSTPADKENTKGLRTPAYKDAKGLQTPAHKENVKGLQTPAYKDAKGLRTPADKNAKGLQTPDHKDAKGLQTPDDKDAKGLQPPAHKENVKGSSLQVPRRSKAKDVKTTLKRATSPGKLCKEVRDVPRNRRLRKPVNFSIDDDDDRR